MSNINDFFTKKRKPTVDEMIQRKKEYDSVSGFGKEDGLIDISAFLVPRVGFKTVKSIPPVHQAVTKYIPNPKIWQRTRDAKNGLFNRGMVAGSGLVIGDSILKMIAENK